MKTNRLAVTGNSLALRHIVCLGWLLVTLWSRQAAGQDAVPFDVYGRPIADELGPISYRQHGDSWIAVHADGSMELTPPVPSDCPPAPSDPAQSGFHFEPYLTIPSGSVPIAVAIGDVTGDGRPDVVMTTGHYFDPANDYKVLVYAQRADGTLAPGVRYSFSVAGDGNGLVLADLDEDGVLDVIVGHGTGISVLLADRQGGLRVGVVTPDADSYKVVAMDVDRDGHMDIISLGWSRGATIFYGDGHGGFRQTAHLDTYARGFNDLKTGDLTGDGINDLAVMTGSYGDYLSIHRHDGVGGFVPGYDSYRMDSNLVAGVGLGDVSGDGLNDAVLSRPTNSPTWLWLMTQNSSDHRLTGPTTIPTIDLPAAVEVADVDGDGREDVVVNHGSWIRLGVYFQSPGGGLGPEVLYPIPYVSFTSGASMAIGDVSSDGCADVVFGTYPLGLVVLHGSGCVPRCQPGLCDDKNSCTDDTCNPATGCVYTPNTNPCDDGNACTAGGTCGGGSCQPGAPVVCNDNNDCTSDTCSPVSGCVYTPMPGAMCDDGNACTTNDMCTAIGICAGGSALDCNDANPCTDDACNPAIGCVHTDNTKPCDDGNACTVGDTCGGGTCNPSGPSNCDDANPCTDDSCDPQNGCIHTNNTNPCSDGNACTVGDTCGAGICNSGVALNCNDNNPCTDDACNPAIGCVHTDNSKPCDDGNACTTGDTCGNGSCHGGPTRSCDDGNACNGIETCNPATGCVAGTPLVCNDGNACNGIETCNPATGCVAGTPVVCTSLDQCHVAGVCDPAGGTCSNPTKPDGVACDDNSLCTTGETCQAGTCTAAYSGLNHPIPRSSGYYQQLCEKAEHGQVPYHGDQITDADAVCVASLTAEFSGFHTAADLCAVIDDDGAREKQHAGDHDPYSHECFKAEDEIIATALNICRARVCEAQNVDSRCGADDHHVVETSVGASFANANTIVDAPTRTKDLCKQASCELKEINNGHALEMNSVVLALEVQAVRLSWLAMELEDGTDLPNKYEVWRRPLNSPSGFTKIGETTGLTFLDTSVQTSSWEYEVTADIP